MEITCYRDSEVSREARCLPATTYNLAITLLARCKNGQLFVPIRSMQYMAILDTEEFVFIDGEKKCWIDIAWRNFQPQARTALDQVVAYDVVFYGSHQGAIMTRLQREFPAALFALSKKDKLENSGRIIKFPGAKIK